MGSFGLEKILGSDLNPSRSQSPPQRKLKNPKIARQPFLYVKKTLVWGNSKQSKEKSDPSFKKVICSEPSRRKMDPCSYRSTAMRAKK